MIFGRLSKSLFFRAVSLFLVVAFSFCNVGLAGATEDSIGVPKASRKQIVRPAGELLSPLARVGYTIPLYLENLDGLYMLSEAIGAIDGRKLIDATGDSYKDMVGELIKGWLDKVRESVTPKVWEKAVKDWRLLLGAYLKKYEEAAEKVGIKLAEGFRVPEGVLTEDALNVISEEFKKIFEAAVARQRRSPGEEAIRISDESDLYEPLTPGQAAGLDGVIAGLMMAGMVEIEEIDVTAVGAASGREQTGKNVSRRMEICKLKGFREAIEEYNRTHEERIPLDVRVHPGSGKDRWVRMYLDEGDFDALNSLQVQRLANHEFYHILNPGKSENEAIKALEDDLKDIRNVFARLERERANEKLLENSGRMAEGASGGVGPDVVIIVSSSREQAAFWQGRLTGCDGKHGSGAVVKEGAVVLSVSESNWKGGAGNGLGTLNGFVRAARKARKMGLINAPEGTAMDVLVDAFLAYCTGKSTFMFHTAGKGTRTAPLPGVELNSKPNIKLPGMVGLAGGEKKPITILESVLRQTSIYAPSRVGRLSVFWGDQVIINEQDVDFEGKHHIEIFGQRVPLDESIKSYGVLIPGEGSDCKQREKLPLEEVRELLPGGSDQVYKSIGSFTISLPFLGAMLEMGDHKEALAKGKGSLNTDPDWWQPLTSTRGEYRKMMGKKGVRKEDADARWDKMDGLWRAFSASQAFSDSGLKGLLGFNDVGRDSLWWDYGQNAYYLKNLRLLTEDSTEGKIARTFFGMEDERVKDSKTGEASIENCVIQNSTIRDGKLKNCVVIDSDLREVYAENAIIIGSTVLELNAHGALCYNVVDYAVKLREGQVLVNVFHPELGRIEMRTDVSRDGSADWKGNVHVDGNPYTYGQIALLMSGVRMADVEKAKQRAIKLLTTAGPKVKKSDRKEEISKKFKPLKFGTSGLRALVTEMTDMECYINTRGFIEFLRERGEIGDKNNEIALGGDLRSSTPGIMTAVAKAIQDSGCELVFCGRVPSPTLAYFAMQQDIPSIMVTGSHIPDDRNGIKFTKKSGEVLKSDEKDILKNVAKAREQEYSKTWEGSLFDKKSMFREKQGLSEAESEKKAIDDYVSRYLKVFPQDALKGKKIVLYQHSAVGRDVVQKILEGLGAEVIPVERSERFIPVDTEKVSEETRALLRDLAKKHKPFAIISTDGDSDRPLLADENGEFLPGDKLGALVSMFLDPEFAAIPISANDAVVSALKGKGVKVKQTRIGSPYVIAAMNAELNNNPGAKVVSWESNGGFLLGSDWTLGGNTLKALPTRDAVLPLLSTLLLARQQGKSVAELIDQSLPARYTHADVVDNKTPGCENYTADMGKVIIKMFSPENSDITQIDFTEGKVKAYYRDGREAMADPELARTLIEIKGKIGHYFTGERGFDEITSINFIDGIRIAFANGDVSHIRPSGNAPEFRNYATADTPERAKEIVEKRNDIVAQIVKDLQSPADDTPVGRIVKAILEGKPVYIRSHNVKKVWGAGEGGIGEYCYGVDSIVVVGEDEAPLSEVISFLRREFLGAGVVENFGPMLPLVKILTPAKRLSVQFHDTKNELWIVTGINEKLAGENPSIILGFSKKAVRQHGKKVTEAYGKALQEYGKKLNLLIKYLIHLGHEDLLKDTGDVVEAAESCPDVNDYVVQLRLSKLKEARDKLERFYNYRSVKVGDVIAVPAGTLHAITPGIEVVEPQIAGDTQALEDGANYMRYPFPGFWREGAKKTLDIDRVNEMKPEVARESKPVVIDGGTDSPFMVERLPGMFEVKGLEVHRVTLAKGARLEKTGITASHNLVVVKGKARVVINGKSYDIPMASPGGEMLIVPASAGEYEIVADEKAQVIDTFTPVPEIHDLGVSFKDGKEIPGTGVHTCENRVSICEYSTGISTYDQVTIIDKMPVPPIINGRPHTLTALKGSVKIKMDDETVVELARGKKYTFEKDYANYTIIKTSDKNAVIRIDYENTEEENMVYATYDMVKKHISKIQGADIDLFLPEEMFIKGGANDPGSKVWEEDQLQKYVSNKIRIVIYSARLGLKEAARRTIRSGATAILVATEANLSNGEDRDARDVRDFLYGKKGKVRVLAIPDIDKEALLREKGWYFNREVVAVALLLAAVTPEQIRAKGESNAASALQKLIGQLTGRAIPRHYLYYMLSHDEMGDALRLLPDHLQKDPLGWLRFLADELLLRMPIKPFNARDELSRRRKLMWSV